MLAIMVNMHCHWTVRVQRCITEVDCNNMLHEGEIGLYRAEIMCRLLLARKGADMIDVPSSVL